MFTQQLINGLALGAVYALIALGYTMVYGILQLINFAHGEVYMLGAYLGIILFGVLTTGPVASQLAAAGLASQDPHTHIVLSLLLATAGAMVFCAAYGAAIERIAY